jgi:hypothetical protein
MKTPKEKQFPKITRPYYESPAHRLMNAYEHRALIRLIVEHQRQGGWVNDGLVVTHRDLVQAGVHPRYVASTWRVLEALGFIERTRNMGGSSSGRTPNLYRPTFLPRKPGGDDATHDYLKITTKAEAKAIIADNRLHQTRKDRPPPRRRKLKTVSAPSITPQSGVVYDD